MKKAIKIDKNELKTLMWGVGQDYFEIMSYKISFRFFLLRMYTIHMYIHRYICIYL